MLGFLRRLRRSLIEEGHLRKYLVYAVGEILLVMVGILLALQVTNWNEARKIRAETEQILLSLQANTESNVQTLQEVNEIERRVIQSIDIVITNLTEVKVYNDSLDHHFLFSVFYPEDLWKSGAYETLKSRGIELVSNDSLRENIVDIYELGLIRLEDVQEISNNYSQSVLYPAHGTHFRVTDYTVSTHEEKAKPTNYAELLKADGYINVLSFWRLHRVYTSYLRSETIENLKNLSNMISEEMSE